MRIVPISVNTKEWGEINRRNKNKNRNPETNEFKKLSTRMIKVPRKPVLTKTEITSYWLPQIN